MTVSVAIPIILGTAKAGLTDLRAQLFNGTGNVGSVVSTGFTGVGNGNYLWEYASVPDGFIGGVKFYSNANPSEIWIDAIDVRSVQATSQLVFTISSVQDTIEAIASQTNELHRRQGIQSGVTATVLDPESGTPGYLRTSDDSIRQTLTKNPDGSVTISRDT